MENVRIYIDSIRETTLTAACTHWSTLVVTVNIVHLKVGA